MRVWVPRIQGKVAVDVDGDIATFATGERCWRWQLVDGGVECLSDVVATSLQRGIAQDIAERAFLMAMGAVQKA